MPWPASCAHIARAGAGVVDADFRGRSRRASGRPAGRDLADRSQSAMSMAEGRGFDPAERKPRLNIRGAMPSICSGSGRAGAGGSRESGLTARAEEGLAETDETGIGVDADPDHVGELRGGSSRGPLSSRRGRVRRGSGMRMVAPATWGRGQPDPPKKRGAARQSPAGVTRSCRAALSLAARPCRRGNFLLVYTICLTP